jgi:hypothetical protein
MIDPLEAVLLAAGCPDNKAALAVDRARAYTMHESQQTALLLNMTCEWYFYAWSQKDVEMPGLFVASRLAQLRKAPPAPPDWAQWNEIMALALDLLTPPGEQPASRRSEEATVVSRRLS